MHCLLHSVRWRLYVRLTASYRLANVTDYNYYCIISNLKMFVGCCLLSSVVSIYLPSVVSHRSILLHHMICCKEHITIAANHMVQQYDFICFKFLWQRNLLSAAFHIPYSYIIHKLCLLDIKPTHNSLGKRFITCNSCVECLPN